MLILAWLLLHGAATAVPFSEPSHVRRTAKHLLEDALLSTLGLVAKYGYEGEEHTVQTEDGYLLTIHRMRSASVRCTGSNKIPVLLQHGLLSSSADWVIMGPGKGLGYILADACFDVWMGNSRGNKYSKDHTRFDRMSDKYWDFSWHEMGFYDTPAVIDYILARTGHQALHYVGHSQGSTQFFVMDSLRPEYHSKIRVMVALAPIAFMSHSRSYVLTMIASFTTLVNWLETLLDIQQLFPWDERFSEVVGRVCSTDHPILQKFCEDYIFVFVGFDESEMNKTMLSTILWHFPAGASRKQFIHYGQIIKSGRFEMYDYGESENVKRYGQKTPLQYPLKFSKTPVELIYGANDLLACPEDVDTLFKKLGKPLGKYQVRIAKFNHFDFLWAIHVKKAVYDYVINILHRH